MGNTLNTNLGVYKIVKYIKVPDRRLFSGLLYINVVNHNENDGKEDFIQTLHEFDDGGTVPAEIADSNMFDITTPTFHDRGRNTMKHSFADYDCFVFSVCGGMSLSGGVTSPSNYTSYRFNDGGASDPLVQNDYVNYSSFSQKYHWLKADGANGEELTPQDKTAFWFLDGSCSQDPPGEVVGDPFGDSCCHFVKYHLLSRVNNGSGHAQNTNNNEFYKHRPTLRKTWTQNVDGDVNSSNPAVVGANDEWILSHGTYDTEESDGTPLTKMELAVRAVGNTANSAYDGMDNDAVADE